MEDETEHMDVDRQSPDYTLAQLTYAPTITETVVTTRTITTTSYPPFVLQGPRDLKHRDPKVYPLLHGPTPALLKKVRLEIGGKTAFFEETERPQEQLDQVCQGQVGARGARCQRLTKLIVSCNTSDIRSEQWRRPYNHNHNNQQASSLQTSICWLAGTASGG